MVIRQFVRTTAAVAPAALLVAGLALGAGSALAQESGAATQGAETGEAQTGGTEAGAPPAAQSGLGLELNNAVDDAGLCRLSYVAVNDTGQPLAKVSYDVVVFDQNGQVSQFLVLQFGQLPAGKTKVVQFDLADQPCAGISRILVNDIAECETSQGSAGICMEALRPTSRTAITFDT
ncbi:hypothetical protein [Jiella pacifica]|uniref:Tat pathway signal sequence domain protein n=1 Tax=Jiella pacifica TaxID=2696469 RepID=A0A6N9T4C4_9HYPH|nr:hypothetical protein [Jiella pacifica]NDW06100.1 hypothetical protein [Jiella pacifica]